jgi:hypothetical protein
MRFIAQVLKPERFGPKNHRPRPAEEPPIGRHWVRIDLSGIPVVRILWVGWRNCMTRIDCIQVAI